MLAIAVTSVDVWWASMLPRKLVRAHACPVAPPGSHEKYTKQKQRAGAGQEAGHATAARTRPHAEAWMSVSSAALRAFEIVNDVQQTGLVVCRATAAVGLLQTHYNPKTKLSDAIVCASSTRID